VSEPIKADAASSAVKERILRAAIHEFGITGYHLTSLRTIAERSGSNKPMIYYHFQGKEGLYLAAVRRLLEETAGILRDVAKGDAPALVKLRRYGEVYLDAFLISRPMMGTVLRELNSLVTPLYHAIADDHNDLVTPLLRRVLAEGVEQGEFRGIDIDGCVGGIVQILLGYARLRGVRPDAAIKSAMDQLIGYYAVGLLSREALAARLEAPPVAAAEGH
jgi:AcrR family transcriptional regulator